MIWTALLSALAAVGVHSYLTLHHIQLRLGISPGTGACNINPSFNCDSVSVSSFSTLLGVPLALWGVWTNLALALLLGLSLIGILQNQARVLRLTTLFSGFVFAVSIIMFGISSFYLKTYCLYCMGAYALSLICFVALLKETQLLKRFEIDDIKDLLQAHRWVLLLLLIVPGGSFLSKAMIDQSYGLSQLQAIVQESLENWKHAPTQDFDENLGLRTSKAGPIKMRIVEFADFKCPHCRMAFPTLDAFAAGRSDVELTFKSFPLDGVCNKDIPRQGDGSTCTLAFSVFCAEKLAKKGWDMHHWIFDNQESFFDTEKPLSLLENQFQPMGLNAQSMKTCLESDETREMVLKMAAEGSKAKIGGTPTIYVNGKLLERGQLVPVLEAVYQSL